MDQTTYPGPPTLFHIRMNSLFFVLWAVDSIMFAFAVESTLTNGVGGMVLFASEVRHQLTCHAVAFTHERVANSVRHPSRKRS